jgi:hypothetical protein
LLVRRYLNLWNRLYETSKIQEYLVLHLPCRVEWIEVYIEPFEDKQFSSWSSILWLSLWKFMWPWWIVPSIMCGITQLWEAIMGPKGEYEKWHKCVCSFGNCLMCGVQKLALCPKELIILNYNVIQWHHFTL